MERVIIVDFSGKLRYYRTQKGFTMDELADLAGITKTSIYSYEKGRRTPTTKIVKQLADALGVPAEDFFRREPPRSSERIITIPILGPISAVCCGDGFSGADTDAPEDYLVIPESFAGNYDPARPPYMVYAEGDSMTDAGILDGSQVVINPAEPVYDGDCALVEYYMTPVTKVTAIKRVYWLDNHKVGISSDCGDGWKRQFKINADENETDEGLVILGKVTWCGFKPKRK